VEAPDYFSKYRHVAQPAVRGAGHKRRRLHKAQSAHLPKYLPISWHTFKPSENGFTHKGNFIAELFYITTNINSNSLTKMFDWKENSDLILIEKKKSTINFNLQSNNFF